MLAIVLSLIKRLRPNCKHFFSIVFFLFSIQNSYAQPGSLTDSLKLVLSSKPTWYGGINSRGSFISGKPVNVRSAFVGLNYSNKLRMGLGYHWMSTDFTKLINNTENTLLYELKFNYISLDFAYVFYEKNNWEVSIPVNLGIGRTVYRHPRLPDKTTSRAIILYEPAMVVEYKLFKYLGVAGGIGFRLMLKNNPLIDEQFNSPIYILRLKINFSEIYKDLSS